MIEIPARKGRAARVTKGQRVKVINSHGQQVVDTWAFNAGDLREFMSMEHSRVAIGPIIPVLGDGLVTNRRRPILTLVEDTSGGATTHCSPPATGGATKCLAASDITIIARTIFGRGWRRWASRRPRPRRRSTCS